MFEYDSMGVYTNLTFETTYQVKYGQAYNMMVVTGLPIEITIKLGWSGVGASIFSSST